MAMSSVSVVTNLPGLRRLEVWEGAKAQALSPPQTLPNPLKIGRLLGAQVRHLSRFIFNPCLFRQTFYADYG
jgi:hypothetical protein